MYVIQKISEADLVTLELFRDRNRGLGENMLRGMYVRSPAEALWLVRPDWEAWRNYDLRHVNDTMLNCDRITTVCLLQGWGGHVNWNAVLIRAAERNQTQLMRFAVRRRGAFRVEAALDIAARRECVRAMREARRLGAQCFEGPLVRYPNVLDRIQVKSMLERWIKRRGQVTADEIADLDFKTLTDPVFRDPGNEFRDEDECTLHHLAQIKYRGGTQVQSTKYLHTHVKMRRALLIKELALAPQ